MTSITEYQIVTIPRTGSHYLKELIRQHLGMNLDKSHEIVNTPIITTFRDPVDTIASSICMNAYTFGALSLNQHFYEMYPSYYIKLGEELIEKASIIVDYEDIINYPNKVIEFFALKFNLSIINTQYQNILVDNPKDGYIVSGSDRKFYPVAKAFAKTLDLSKLYPIYEQLKSKSILIK